MKGMVVGTLCEGMVGTLCEGMVGTLCEGMVVDTLCEGDGGGYIM